MRRHLCRPPWVIATLRPHHITYLDPATFCAQLPLLLLASLEGLRWQLLQIRRIRVFNRSLLYLLLLCEAVLCPVTLLASGQARLAVVHLGGQCAGGSCC